MRNLPTFIKTIPSMVFFGLMACANQGQKMEMARKPTDTKAIINVTVISMNDGEVLSDHTVIVKKGKIESILPSTSIPEGVEIIDGNGKFLVPGLAEMHAHIPIPHNGNEELVEQTLFLYLSNGVTTIRGMLGNPYHLTLRDEINHGDRVGPRIYTSGPSFNGTSTPTPETAAVMVRKQAKMGYDFLKMHPGLSRATFDEIDRVADSVGIGFSGHISVDVGIRRSLEARYRSIDHMDGYIEGLVPENLNVDPSSNGFFGINFTDIADLRQLDMLVDLTRRQGVWVVPTQSLLERWAGPIDPEVIGAEAEMQYMSPDTRKSWVARVKEFQDAEDFNREQAARFIELRRQILKSLYDSGVDLILGSDAPQIFNVPGFSIQHELKAMVNIGLSPEQALELGTVNPARFFGQEGTFGQIIQGASADLILLDENPLEDIDRMRNPAGVMVKGNWFSRAMIDERLNEISTKYSVK